MAEGKQNLRGRPGNANPPLRPEEVERAAHLGSQRAVEKTLGAGRPITIAREGWVVREFPDGRIEKISKLESAGDRHYP